MTFRIKIKSSTLRCLLCTIVCLFYYSCIRESKVIKELHYDTGELKSQLIKTSNDSIMSFVAYYKNGAILSTCDMDCDRNIIGLCKVYYPDGQIMINSEFVGRKSKSDVYVIPPEKDSCFIQIEGYTDKSGQLIKIKSDDTINLVSNSTIWFRFYAGGVPPDSFFLLIYRENGESDYVLKDSSYSPNYPVNFPLSFDTTVSNTSIWLCCYFHDDKDRVVLSKEPFLKFRFNVR